MNAIFRKELRSYFTGFTGYILTAVMLIMIGIFSMIYNLSYQSAAFEYVYGNCVFILMLLVPILTMRLFPEEKRQKTDQLLYSLPIKMSDIVLGKYLASICVLGIPCIISGIYPLVFSAFGNINFKIVYASLFSFFLLGATLTAICMFISLLTENQIIAAIISFIVILINYFLNNLTSYISSSLFASVVTLVILIILFSIIVRIVTQNKILADIISIVLLIALLVIRIVKSSLIEGFVPKILKKIMLFDSFYDFIYGKFYISSIILFLSFIVVFVYISIQALERRRWA